MTADQLRDRELLELAAKAAGHEFGEINGVFKAKIEQDIGTCGTYGCQKHQWRDWNPLADDGDALRLAVKLRLSVDCTPNDGPQVDDTHTGHREPWGNDPNAATRRAIVRAAAEIGRSME